MDFSEFQKKYIKKSVIEYPNNRKGKTPIVTVKLVTYNHINFIKQCLDSILMQKTNFDFEILIAEDDSNDGTREVCIEYAEKFPDKIKLLLNSRANNIPINGKPSGTFNSVYANFCIKSKYINMIEGDDYWTDENSLQVRVDFLEKNDDFILCFHNSKVYYELTKKFDNIKKANSTIDRIIIPEDILSTHMYTSTLLYRNGLIEVFEQDMLKFINGDVILRAKLSKFGKGMFLSNISDAVYRIHSGGIYGGAPWEVRFKNSKKTRDYLKRYFEKKHWDLKPLYSNYYKFYFDNFKEKIYRFRKFDLIFLKEAFKYSKLSNKSFFLPLFLFFYNALKRKLLCQK